MTDILPVADLVDQHCHGMLRTELGLGTFEARLATAATAAGRPAPGTTFFDTQTGFAVRRWCPPLLGLEPHCPAAGYLARRRELGVLETGRRLLRATGVSTYLVDTGLPGDLTGPAEVAVASGADAREIVRLESLAEQIADTSGTVESFLVNLAEAVHTSAASAAAFTSVAAARHGLGPDPGPPGPGAVRGAAGRWLAGREAERRAARTGGGGLNAPYRTPDDPVLLRHLLWTAVACGRPLQFHLTRSGWRASPPPRPGSAATWCCFTATRITGTPRSSRASIRMCTPTWAPLSPARGRAPRPSSRRSSSWPRSASCSSPVVPRGCRNSMWWARGSSAMRSAGCWAAGWRTALGRVPMPRGSPR